MADPRLPGIYAIRNKISGRCYIGSASNIATRWSTHRCILRRGTHHSSWLQRSWTKHGADRFIFEVLEFIQDRTKLIEREQFWLESLKGFWEAGGYNICPVAQSRLGRKHSAVAKAKISAAHKGRKHTPEARARMAQIQRERYQNYIPKPVSEETRRKIGLASRARGAANILLTPENRAKVGRARKGTKLPATHVANMRAARLGVPWTEAQREAILLAKRKKSERLRVAKLAAKEARIREFGKNGQLGKRHSPETIARMKDARRAQRPMSEEARAKISRANKGRKSDPDVIRRRLEGLANWKPTERQVAEHRARTAATGKANKGRVHSAEARRNMSASQKARRAALKTAYSQRMDTMQLTLSLSPMHSTE